MSAETETGSDGASTPTTNGHKTSPAAAYRKTNGHDLDGSYTALEEATVSYTHLRAPRD